MNKGMRYFVVLFREIMFVDDLFIGGFEFGWDLIVLGVSDKKMFNFVLFRDVNKEKWLFEGGCFK